MSLFQKVRGRNQGRYLLGETDGGEGVRIYVQVRQGGRDICPIVQVREVGEGRRGERNMISFIKDVVGNW